MAKDISLIVEVIDGNYVLVNRIVDIWNIKRVFFVTYRDILKITYGIIGDITKKAIVDKFKAIGICFKTFCEFGHALWNVGLTVYTIFVFATVRKVFYNTLVFYFN